MNDLEGLAKVVAEILKRTIEIQSQLDVLKSTVIGLGRGFGMDPAKMLETIDAQARKLTEEKILALGDTNPAAADLMGADSLLKPPEPDEPTQD